ncbi:hypothetical protein BN7_2363 [Wickerhamomyces ciferrii]|uniref:Phospholipid/glycerol acyltransferase domain-containing protein n=1 Tax=Wickerhamomyces ciferrii (strain ATCC 14091 / BCRC 22168 / CBS 111 / JCM 3599 / NBRC 0793 / NRRL Y-1031 F-60-10) TaxID=1206466 RepID=K0KNZ0_WICCF|nr:uncharacterized protein BN7_2363 [Wickerhamomyces ciferrii]CCH42818.1 hypothetical protein BN7_2363 [Wickerhamomyces ciferrii]
MERYTQWRDKSTGISPFLPILQSNVLGYNESSIGKIIKNFKIDLVGSFILVLIKVVVILPLLLLSLVIGGIIGHGQIWWLNRLILSISGLTSYELTIQNLKSKNLNKSFYPSKGDVFLCNFSSPLDLITLYLISNDDFVILLPNTKGGLSIQSISQFLKKSISGVLLDEIDSLIDYKQLENKIIYIFPEGTTSNGKSILPFKLNQTYFNEFINNLQSDKKTHKIRTLGLKYYPSTLVTPISYSSWSFLFKILSQLTYNVKARINFPNQLNSIDTDLNKLRLSFTNNGKFKLVSDELDINSKKAFIENYIGRR